MAAGMPTVKPLYAISFNCDADVSLTPRYHVSQSTHIHRFTPFVYSHWKILWSSLDSNHMLCVLTRIVEIERFIEVMHTFSVSPTHHKCLPEQYVLDPFIFLLTYSSLHSNKEAKKTFLGLNHRFLSQ